MSNEKEDNREKVMTLKTQWRHSTLVALLLILLLVPQLRAFENNRVRDLYFYEREKEDGIVYLLKALPAYTLDNRAQGEVLVELQDVEVSTLVYDRIKENGWPFHITTEGGTNLNCVMKPSGLVRELRTTWFPEKKLLFLQFFLKKQATVGDQPRTAVYTHLNGLEFGVKRNFTRTVMRFDGKPHWAMSFTPERQFDVELAGGEAETERRNFGPIPRLRMVRIKALSNGLRVVFTPESFSAYARLFWLDVGHRLVMDIFDEPDMAAVNALLLPPGFGKEEKPALAATRIRARAPEGKSAHTDEKKAFSSVPEMIPAPEDATTKKPEKDSNTGEGPFLRRSIELPMKPVASLKAAKVAKPQHANDQIGHQLLAIPLKAEKAFNLDPEEALAYGKIWKAKELEHFVEASTLIDQFLVRFPLSAMSNQLWFLKGDMLFSRLKGGEKGLLSEVLKTYHQAISRSDEPDNVVEGYMKMAKSESLMGNDIAGVSFLNSAIKHCKACPSSARAHLKRGRLLMKLGSPEKAVLDFKEVLARYPNSNLAASALFGIAQYLHKKGLFQNAETRLEKIADLDKKFWQKNPDFFPLRAQNFLYLKDYDRARSLFFKALNLGSRPEGKDLLLTHIGDTFLYQFRPKEAEKMYGQVIVNYPGSEGAVIAELRLADLFGDVEALKKVRDQSQGEVTGAITELKIANAYYNKGRYKLAMESLKGLASKPPKDSMIAAARELFRDAAEKKMDQLYRNHEYAEVVETFKANESLLKDRIDPNTQLLVALSAYQLKRYDDAIPAFKAMNPQDLSIAAKGEYYVGLGKCYLETGDKLSVVKLLEDGRKANLSEKDRLRVTYFLADLYKTEREFKKADALFAWLMDSENHLNTEKMSRLYLSRGEVLNRLGAFQKAGGYLKRSIALSEQVKASKRFLFLGQGFLGNSFLGEKKYGEALIHYKKALEMGYGENLPEYWEFKLGQAEALMEVEDRDSSSNLLREIYEMRGPGPRYWAMMYKLAKEYLRSGSGKKAEICLAEIAEEGPWAMQSEAQLQMGALILKKNLRKLSIWPEIAVQEVQHASP